MTEELIEARKRIAALTGLLSRLAAEVGIEHGGPALEENVVAFCDQRRAARAVEAMQSAGT